MVLCCVVGCSNRTIRDTVRFFRFPGSHKSKSKKLQDLKKLRRNTWLLRVGRKDLFDNQKRVDISRVCSDHFVRGEPSTLENSRDVDWAPSLYLGHNYFNKDGKNCIKRKKRRIDSKSDTSKEEECDIPGSVKELEPCTSNATIIFVKTEQES